MDPNESGNNLITGEQNTGGPTGNEVITGETRTDSPFDALFSDGALDKLPDGGLKEFVSRHKSGIELEKGFDSVRAKATDKGYERPSDDAPEEVWNAFNERLPKLLGIPESADDYKFDFSGDEDFKADDLREETLERFRQLGFEKQIPSNVAQELVKAVVAEEHEAIKSHNAEQIARANELMGGEQAFNEIAGDLQAYAESAGFDVSQSAFRQADTWLLVKQNMELEARIAQLTGEETHLDGQAIGTGDIEAKIKEIQADPLYAGQGPESRKLHDQVLELVKQKTARRK